MSSAAILKRGFLVGLVACVFAAACSGDGGRGDEPAVSDTNIADTTTTTTTTETVAEPSTTPEAEPTTTTTQSVAEPSTTAAVDTTTTDDVVDSTTASEPVVVIDPETTAPSTTEPTTDPPTTDPPTTDPPTTDPPTSAPSTESTAAPETTAPETTAPDDTTTTASTTTISVELENSRNVECGEGLVKLDEFVTETDNGCRRADCYGGGRNDNGECRSYGEWLDTLDRDCPTADTSDGLGMYGASDSAVRREPADLAFPQMVAGSSWVAHIAWVDNDNWDWWEDGLEPTNVKPYFSLGVGAGDYKISGSSTSRIFASNEPSGSERLSFSIPGNHPSERVFKAGVRAKGAGCWSVRFERTG